MEKLLKKYQLEWTDILYLAAMTMIGLAIRAILRVVTTVDWEMYWDPWISDLKEMGFSYLATDRYDYAPSFVYILWVISKLPINPMTGYKAIHIALDFVAAAVMGKLVMDSTGSKIKSFCAYGLMLIVPTIWADSALWAQCDIIFTSFVMLSLLYMLKDKPRVSLIFYGIAFAFKLQTFFILPLYVLLWVKKKMKIQHFLWVPLMYFIGVIPSWIAGKSLWELLTVYLFQANGEMDIYALSHKFPNIYQIIGTDSFLREYADAGIYFTLAVLMILMYYIAGKKFIFTKDLIIRMGMFFVMAVVYFLPHMHERYGILADVLSVAVAFYNSKKFYVPLIAVICSFGGYTLYLAQSTVVPMWVYAVLYLGLMIDLGIGIYKDINGMGDKNCIMDAAGGN